MQQSYWAGDAVGATEVLDPLMGFIAGDDLDSGLLPPPTSPSLFLFRLHYVEECLDA